MRLSFSIITAFCLFLSLFLFWYILSHPLGTLKPNCQNYMHQRNNGFDYYSPKNTTKTFSTIMIPSLLIELVLVAEIHFLSQNFGLSLLHFIIM